MTVPGELSPAVVAEDLCALIDLLSRAGAGVPAVRALCAQADSAYPPAYRKQFGSPATVRTADVLAALGGAEPLHEWRCPSCGATTRARMADSPADAGAPAAEPAPDVLVQVADLPEPRRGSGPVSCCGYHRERCTIGRQHLWHVWMAEGKLQRTGETWHCYRCGGTCIAEEPNYDDAGAGAPEPAQDDEPGATS